MSTFTQRLNAATDTTDPAVFISRVKAVVGDEIREADPSISLVDTGYFANSAIPDFEAAWATSKQQRPIFLRNGLADVVAGHDTAYLPAKDPAILTLDTVELDEQLIEEAGVQADSKPDALIATGTSFNSSVLTSDSEESSPLAQLVRTNFVRGARGLITPESLLGFASAKEGDDADSAREEEQLHLIASHFDERVAHRIRALSDLLGLARMGTEEFQAAVSGRDLLSTRLESEELKWLLPALLGLDSVPSTEFWRAFGKLFELRDLERQSGPFQGLNLTDLVEANKESWTARRAYSGLWIEDPSAMADTALESASMEDYWTFTGTVLSKRIPESARRIAVAWDGTKLKRAPSESSKSWEQANTLIEELTLLEVNLKGVQRSVSVNAEQSTDIRADVTDITTSVEDQYLVATVTLGLQNLDNEIVRAEVDLGGSMISAGKDVKLSELVDTATKVFQDRMTDPSTEV